MSNTVRVTADSYHDEIEEIFPIEPYDTIEGVYEGHKFEVTYDPTETEEEVQFRGDYRLSIFAPKEDVDDNRGGTVWYSERHREPDGYHELRPLFFRARKIAVRIASSDDYHECPYCGFMAYDNWKIEKSIPILTRRPLKRAIPTHTDKHTDICAGLSSWLPPKIEVYKHRSDENPIFDERELENCDTLKMAKGYPKWQYESELYPYTHLHIKSLLEHNPSVFDDDLDIETMKRTLEYLSHNQDRPREQLVDKTKMDYRDGE